MTAQDTAALVRTAFDADNAKDLDKLEALAGDLHDVEDGKVARLRSYYDALTVLQQLGLTPEALQP